MLTSLGGMVLLRSRVEDDCIFGKVKFINDSIVFGADTVSELKSTFEAEVDDYLEFCAEVSTQVLSNVT